MVPAEYRRAEEFFVRFLEDAMKASGLSTINQSYTMVQGVLQAFRRRIEIKDAIRFAGVLPVGARALFVADWDPDETIVPFGDRGAMTREAQALRSNHNFSPDNAIRSVAIALRRNVDEQAFDRVLARLPRDAAAFWSVE